MCRNNAIITSPNVNMPCTLQCTRAKPPADITRPNPLTKVVATAIDSFWIRTITGGIGPIHLFSVLVMVQVPRAIWFARKGQIDRHMRAMRGTYFGLIAAGVIAMAPGRMLWTLLFG